MTQRTSIHVTVKTVTVRTEEAPDRLHFGRGNAKLDDAIYTFSLPAGHFCPFAGSCKSQAHPQTGHITDGPHTEFRCYAASLECIRSSARSAYWHNARLLRGRTTAQMAKLILASLSPYAGYVRIHNGGDFFSQGYFDAWLQVARKRPRTTFYAYTKALPFWARRLRLVGNGFSSGRLTNFVLTASFGGTHDHLIAEHGLRFARVVFSQTEAYGLGLEIDHDDTHAMRHGPSFALLLHGPQPAGSPAAKAVAALRARGVFGYGRKAEVRRRGLTVLN